MNDEGEQNLELVASMESDFNKLGITLYDTDGQMKSTFDILSDLAEVYPDLDQNTKNYYAALIGGKTQVDVVNSVISNFNTALEANQAAMNSTGSAMNENSIYMDSLGAKVNQIRSEFEKLSTSLISSNLVGTILDLTKGLLQFVNTDVGKALIKYTALITTIQLLTRAGSTLKATILSNGRALYSYLLVLQGVPAAEAAASASTLGLAGSIKILTTAMLSNPLFWGAAAIVLIQGVAKAIDAVTVSAEEARENFQNVSQSYEQTLSELNDINSSLEEKKKTLKEMENISAPSLSNKSETEKLKVDIALLEDKKKILDAIAEDEKKQAAKSAEQALTTKEKIGTGEWNPTTRKSRLYANFEQHADVDHIEKVNVELQKYIRLQQMITGEIENKSGYSIEQLGEKLSGLKSSILYTVRDLQTYKDALLEVDEETRKTEGYDILIDRIDNAIDNYYKMFPAQEQAIDSSNKQISTIESLNSYLETLSSDMSSLEEKYKILTSAVDEYNESGYITAETLQSLTDNNLLQYLEWTENGLVANTNALFNQADAAKIAAINSLQTSYAQDVLAISEGKVAESGGLAKTALENVRTEISGLGTLAEAQAGGLFTLAKAQSVVAAAGGKLDVEKYGSQLTQLNNYYNNLAKTITSISIGETKGHYSGSSKAKATTSKTVYQPEIDALYEYNNVLDIAKENVNKFKDELDDAEGYDEQIEKTNQLIEALRKQIAATENLKNAQADQIDNYINQLKQQGFIIDYNRKTNELYIRNMQHLADFSGDGAKEIENLIKEIQSMNKENRSLDSSIRNLTNDVDEYYDTLADIPEQKLEKFKELMSAFQESQLQDLKDEIEDINHEMENDPRLKALEEQIEALEKENNDIEHQQELEEKLLAIEEAKERLRNAREQKTLQVYKEGEGWTWIVDPDKVKEAQEDLADAQADLSDFVKEDQIAALEAEKEAIEKSYQDRIDVLENFLDEQNYLIDKSNRETIETLDELMNKMAEFGVDGAENLATVNAWINNYNESLKSMNNTLNNLSSGVSNGVLYNSTAQDRINSALSDSVVSTNTASGLALNGLSYSSGSGSDGTNIYIDKIELPNVQNADDFVEALRDLPRLAISQASSRQ